MSERTSRPLFGAVYGAGMCLLLGLLVFGTAGKDAGEAAGEYAALREELPVAAGTVEPKRPEEETARAAETGSTAAEEDTEAQAEVTPATEEITAETTVETAGAAAAETAGETATALTGLDEAAGSAGRTGAAAVPAARMQEGSVSASETAGQQDESAEAAAAEEGTSLWEKYAAINPDFVGILSFPYLDMEYPVVQGQDNREYLSKTFGGKESAAGCVFLDCTASPDLTDRNTFLFAHNMADGSMFGSLKLLARDPDLAKKNPDGIFFRFYTEADTVTCRVIGFGPVDKQDDAVYCHVATDAEYDAWFTHALSGSWYSPGASVLESVEEERPRLVILSTCWGTDHTRNFILIGAVEE